MHDWMEKWMHQNFVTLTDLYKKSEVYFTAQWSLYVPHSGHYMYRQFNIQQYCVLPTQCV